MKRSQPRPVADGERCEVCSAPLAGAHRHVLCREPRRVLCSCAPCSILFGDPAGRAARLRTIPERVLSDPRASISDARWAALGVPVGLAFFVTDAVSGIPSAHCPSPGGVVEIEVDREAWEAVATRTPLVRVLEPDVEALLVYRPRGGPAAVFLAPIDACYELAGVVRTNWRGLEGGDEARRAIEAFIGGLRARSSAVAGAPTGHP